MPVDIESLRIRTLFLSDLHLGFRLANAEAALHTISKLQPTQVYLVGDTIDHWRLKHRWHWPTSHAQVLTKLTEMHESGIEFFVCPGNHDHVLRNETFLRKRCFDDRCDALFLPLLKMNVAEAFAFESLLGKKFLVTHGDIYDDVHDRTGGISALGSKVFDIGSWMLPKRVVHGLRSIFKVILSRPNLVNSTIVAEAQNKGFDGVVYGHMHNPTLTEADGFLTANTGDWVEHQTMMAELDDGEFIMIECGEVISKISPSPNFE